MTVEWSAVKHFSQSEFTEPDKMQPDLVHALDDARERAGVPIYITSDYRDGDDGAHGSGWAVDIADDRDADLIGSRWRYLVVKALLLAGFNRVGVYDKHVHADRSPELDQRVMWWGTSD